MTSIHHPDCDGYRTAHRVTIERERTPSARCPFLYRAVCAECGPLHIGSVESQRELEVLYIGHSREVLCDGRCMEWT